MEILIQKHPDSRKCIPLHGLRFKQRCDGKPSYHCTRTVESDDDH
jgi:hypothetical protein